MLGDESSVSHAIERIPGSDWTFKAVKAIILSALNVFSTDCQKWLIGTSLRVDFKNLGQSNQLTGLFTESGSIGMLEKADLTLSP